MTHLAAPPELPPLPEPDWSSIAAWQDQMRAYAAEAVRGVVLPTTGSDLRSLEERALYWKQRAKTAEGILASERERVRAALAAPPTASDSPVGLVPKGERLNEILGQVGFKEATLLQRTHLYAMLLMEAQDGLRARAAPPTPRVEKPLD